MDKSYQVFLKSGGLVTVDAQAVKIKEDGTVALAQSTESNTRITYLDPTAVECIVEERSEDLDEE